MYKVLLNEKEELVIFVDKTGEPCYTVIDHSRLFNRKKYFDEPTLNNPNYVRSLKRAERAEREKGKSKDNDKELIFDTTETIPAFNYNHDVKRFKNEINKLIEADVKCYDDLKQGKITCAVKEIAEYQHQIDKLTAMDKVDFMAGIQRKKRHSRFLKLIFAESANRKTMRNLGFDSMSHFKLSYLSQIYVTLLYSWGYSAESIESLMGLKNGYINHITKNIVQHVKREFIIEFETDLAWKDISKFEPLVLTTGRNLTNDEIIDIQNRYLKTSDIKQVMRETGRSEKTVRKWVEELQKIC